MKLTLRTITYHPATGAVTMMLENALRGGFSVTTTEAKLIARLAPSAAGCWGNDEALAEAQALVATAQGFVAATARDAEQFPDEGFVVAFAPPPSLPALTVRARKTASTPTTDTVRVAVADAIPQGAASATITYQDQGSGGVSPASGGTVTPAATLTEAAGTFIDYVVTRPAVGAGPGRVIFTITAANRTSVSDAVGSPERASA